MSTDRVLWMEGVGPGAMVHVFLLTRKYSRSLCLVYGLGNGKRNRKGTCCGVYEC